MSLKKQIEMKNKALYVDYLTLSDFIREDYKAGRGVEETKPDKVEPKVPAPSTESQLKEIKLKKTDEKPDLPTSPSTNYRDFGLNFAPDERCIHPTAAF